jgi:hypothetical protein
MALPYTRLEARQWTRTHLKGLEAVIFPSFTPDLRDNARRSAGDWNLNEEGL